MGPRGLIWSPSQRRGYPGVAGRGSDGNSTEARQRNRRNLVFQMKKINSDMELGEEEEEHTVGEGDGKSD